MLQIFFQLLFFGALALSWVFGGSSGQSSGPMPEIAPYREIGDTRIIPLIRMQRVPLADAIRNLAREERINYIIDPSLSEYIPAARPVTASWTNVTAAEALDEVLQLRHLKLAPNLVTGVARIVAAERRANPPVANPVGNGTNWIIPLIVIDEVSVPQAIRHVAKITGTTVSFDKRLRMPIDDPNGAPIVECYVSIRWEDLTAQQALGALLDIYDLEMVEAANGASAFVTARGQTQGATARMSGLETTGL